MINWWATTIFLIGMIGSTLYAVLCTFAKWPQNWTCKQMYAQVRPFVQYWGGVGIMTAIVYGITFLVMVLAVLFGATVEWWTFWIALYIWQFMYGLMWFASMMAYNPKPDKGKRHISARIAIGVVNKFLPRKLIFR